MITAMAYGVTLTYPTVPANAPEKCGNLRVDDVVLSLAEEGANGLHRHHACTARKARQGLTYLPGPSSGSGECKWRTRAAEVQLLQFLEDVLGQKDLDLLLFGDGQRNVAAIHVQQLVHVVFEAQVPQRLAEVLQPRVAAAACVGVGRGMRSRMAGRGDERAHLC